MYDLDDTCAIIVDLTLNKRNKCYSFISSDDYTIDFYIKVTDLDRDYTDYKNKEVYLYALTPSNNLVYMQLYNDENNMLHLELPREFKNMAGYYKCQLLIIDTLTEERVFSQTRFKYRVKNNVAMDYGEYIEESEEAKNDYSLLTYMIERLDTIEESENERVSNENSRVENESDRESRFKELETTIIELESNVNTLIDNYNNVVSIQNKNILDNKEAQDKKLEESINRQDDYLKSSIESQNSYLNTSIENQNNTIAQNKELQDNHIDELFSNQDTTIDFDLDGNLVVTINGITKKFKPI